jgi:hypothetical protein
MALHPIHTVLAKLRARSRWPHINDFGKQLKMKYGCFRCYEDGRTIPNPEMLQRILDLVDVDQKTAAEIKSLRDNAQAIKLGIATSVYPLRPIDFNALAKRIGAEVAFVLKQEGITVKRSTRSVVEKRALMILKSVIGDVP